MLPSSFVKDTKIKVVVRFRGDEENIESWNLHPNGQGLEPPKRRADPTNKDRKTYMFDRVLDGDESQSEMYEAIARDNVDKVLEGANSTIFAYG